ncbi:MAG: PDZ domain-containing protein [Planctomycetota bacterium]
MKLHGIVLLPALAALGAGCAALFPPDLPDELPPLADLVEPPELFAEPQDDAARQALPRGAFTGANVVVRWRSLEEAGTEEPGIRIKEIIENSPADIAGLRADDVLLRARDARSVEHELSWPSRWRQLELDATPGDAIAVVLERAGVEMRSTIHTIARVRPASREPSERYREESRVGVVLRTATEVEARQNGLAPGAGAVVVGLSTESPWREAGVRFGDLIVAAGGKPVDHPQVVLDAIRTAGETLELELVRDGEHHPVRTSVTRRQGEIRWFTIPLLFEYEKERGKMNLSILFGLIRHETTPHAWECRLLWLIRLQGGEADRLEEVSAP